MIVYRDTKPANIARPLRVGDVVRDRHFPTAIDRVTSINDWFVALEADRCCSINLLSFAYEHADGAPISGVQP